MSGKQRLFLMTYAAPLLVIGLGSLGHVWNSYQKDYHWTGGRLSLDARQGRFEVYVRGKMLDRALEDGDLAFRRGDSWMPLEKSDVGVRLNEIDRATRAPLVTGAACLAAGLMWVLAVIVIGREQRPERNPGVTGAR